MRLTDKRRKKMAPTRASGGARWPTPRQAKQLTRAFSGRETRRRLACLRDGLTIDVEPELTPAREAAFAIVSSPTLERLAAAPLDVLAVAERMFSRAEQGATLTHGLVLARGLVDAVDVKRRSLGYDLRAEPHWSAKVFAVTGRVRNPERRQAAWLALRHAVCAAPVSDYESARALAQEGWSERSTDENALLAFAFPDEPWADALLRGSSNLRHWFLLSACRDPAIALAMARLPHGAHQLSVYALELAHALPKQRALALFAEILPTLLHKPKHRALFKTPPRAIVEALAAIGGPEAAATLAGYVGEKTVGAAVMAFFQDTPEERAALRGSEASPAASALAERLEEQSALGRQARPAAGQHVPEILTQRAWRPSGPASEEYVVPDVALPHPLPERVEPMPERRGPELPQASRELLQVWREGVASGHGSVDSIYDHAARARFAVPADESLAAWSGGGGYLHAGPVAFLAAHGVAAIGGLVRPDRLKDYEYEGATDWIDALGRVKSPRAAATWAALAARKRWRRVAHAWLEENVQLAAVGLAPAAVGRPGPARKNADAALRHLMRAGHSEAIRDAAAVYEPAVREALERLLCADLRVIHVRPPKAPAFLRKDALPPLALRAGGSLPTDARDALLELLSVAPVGYAGYVSIAAACEPASLDAFVAALLQQWSDADGPGRGDWAARAVAALPGPGCVDLLCRLARRWARSKQAPAARACDVLAALGSDEALMHLAHIAATTRFKNLRERTARRIDEVARARGWSRDELEDRTVPDLGLDASGSLVLRFSETELRVSLDETLRVTLRDENHTRLRSFPRAKTTDADEPARQAAKARYDRLKKDAKSIGAHQRRRLERAMCRERTWPLDEARAYLFEHALSRHLARGLIWMSGAVPFRVAEDGGYLDRSDEAVVLDARAPVRIAHRLELAEPEAWARVLADYEILQPFAQLGRSVFSATDAELERIDIQRCEGWRVSPKKLLGVLETRGWRRDRGDVAAGFERAVGQDVVVRLAFEPAFEIAYLSTASEVTLGTVAVLRDHAAAGVRALGAIGFSEVMLDLEALR